MRSSRKTDGDSSRDPATAKTEPSGGEITDVIADEEERRYMFRRPVSPSTSDDVDWFRILTAPSEKRAALLRLFLNRL